jgi:hypothetical protein
MTYPPAPWNLQGYACQTLQPVDTAQARALVPTGLTIISLWPGKTVGGVYLATYGPGSALEYHELIVVAALVSYAGRVGCWISHIYVDNPDSVAGGREIWGLPKELAEFTWEQGQQSRVVVRQAERQLCTLSYEHSAWGWRQGFPVPGFSTLETNLLLFQGEANARIGVTRAQLEVPGTSPFASLSLGQPWLAVNCEALNLVVHAPQVVAQGDRCRRPVGVGR